MNSILKKNATKLNETTLKRANRGAPIIPRVGCSCNVCVAHCKLVGCRWFQVALLTSSEVCRGVAIEDRSFFGAPVNWAQILQTFELFLHFSSFWRPRAARTHPGGQILSPRAWGIDSQMGGEISEIS